VYVAWVAPLITEPLRSQATLVDVGVFRNPPVMHDSVEPTVGVPMIVGGATGTGAWQVRRRSDDADVQVGRRDVAGLVRPPARSA
jgi:hypothetical protein